VHRGSGRCRCAVHRQDRHFDAGPHRLHAGRPQRRELAGRCPAVGAAVHREHRDRRESRRREPAGSGAVGITGRRRAALPPDRLHPAGSTAVRSRAEHGDGVAPGSGGPAHVGDQGRTRDGARAVPGRAAGPAGGPGGGVRGRQPGRRGRHQYPGIRPSACRGR
jgi:hypothetical protein